MRNKEVDAYMEKRFGPPKFKKSFRQEDRILTPMGDGKYRIFRVDPLPLSRRK
jgi:hypothetical protein